MVRGSCACGDYTYEVSEAPEQVVICHCIPCRKFAGLNGSTSALVSADHYKILSGSTRAWTRDGDSGKDVTNQYCSSCGTLMYVEAPAVEGMLIYKPGTLDEKLDDSKPVAECYTRNRPNCFESLRDTKQELGAL